MGERINLKYQTQAAHTGRLSKFLPKYLPKYLIVALTFLALTFLFPQKSLADTYFSQGAEINPTGFLPTAGQPFCRTRGQPGADSVLNAISLAQASQKLGTLGVVDWTGTDQSNSGYFNCGSAQESALKSFCDSSQEKNFLYTTYSLGDQGIVECFVFGEYSVVSPYSWVSEGDDFGGQNRLLVEAGLLAAPKAPSTTLEKDTLLEEAPLNTDSEQKAPSQTDSNVTSNPQPSTDASGFDEAAFLEANRVTPVDQIQSDHSVTNEQNSNQENHLENHFTEQADLDEHFQQDTKDSTTVLPLDVKAFIRKIGLVKIIDEIKDEAEEYAEIDERAEELRDPNGSIQSLDVFYEKWDRFFDRYDEFETDTEREKALVVLLEEFLKNKDQFYSHYDQMTTSPSELLSSILALDYKPAYNGDHIKKQLGEVFYEGRTSFDYALDELDSRSAR